MIGKTQESISKLNQLDVHSLVDFFFFKILIFARDVNLNAMQPPLRIQLMLLGWYAPRKSKTQLKLLASWFGIQIPNQRKFNQEVKRGNQS